MRLGEIRMCKRRKRRPHTHEVYALRLEVMIFSEQNSLKPVEIRKYTYIHRFLGVLFSRYSN